MHLWMQAADRPPETTVAIHTDMRVLIADDSLVSRHLLEATLRKWNYEVKVACDGTEAWNMRRSDDPPRIAPCSSLIGAIAYVNTFGRVAIAIGQQQPLVVQADKMRRVLQAAGDLLLTGVERHGSVAQHAEFLPSLLQRVI